VAYEERRIKGALASFHSWEGEGKELNPDKWGLEVDDGPGVAISRDDDNCWHIFIRHETVPDDERDPEGNVYLRVSMNVHPFAEQDPTGQQWEQHTVLFEHKPDNA
jgi:hypothetical protein